MAKIKLNPIKLKNICGGKKYNTIVNFDVSKPAAITSYNGIEFAFNLHDDNQINYILYSSQPMLYGYVDLDPDSTPFYELEDIFKCHSRSYLWYCKWHTKLFGKKTF